MSSFRDSGLQPERTSLAWTRTALSLVVNAILLLRVGVQDSDPALLASGVALCGIAACLIQVGLRRGKDLSARAAAPGAGIMLLTSRGVVLGSIAAAC